MIKTRIYSLWSNLAHNIANPKSKAYKGIPLSPRWQEFALFHEDMGEEYEEGQILQLVDPNLPYSKENCRWVTKSKIINQKQL